MVKSDVLAQEARFKVARTSYFKGDFVWAKVQVDVLRKSASQLIANDGHAETNVADTVKVHGRAQHGRKINVGVA